MDLLKQAFSELERTVEKTVTEAASAVVESANEYPKPAAEPVRVVKQLHTSAKAAAKQVQSVETSWSDFDWQDHQATWEAALLQLQGPQSKQTTAAELQQQLLQLYEELLSLQDPLPALSNAAVLANKAAELESTNKSLQQQVTHLQQDQTEVTQLLKDYKHEQAAHAALQTAHKTLQDEVSNIKASQQSSSQLQEHVTEQQQTISNLQAAFSSLRKEFEASQSALFELMSQQEAAAGSATTAEQLAVEEIERLTVELHQTRRDKQQLQQELQQYLQQQQQGAHTHTAAAVRDAVGTKSAAAAGDDAVESSSGSSVGQEQQQYEVELAAMRQELEAAKEAARDQQHEVALLTTKLAAADSRIQRLTAELDRRPPASAAAAMAEQLAAVSALLGQQLETEGWGHEGAAAAVAAVTVPGQLEPLLQERCRKLEQNLQVAKSEAAAAQSAVATAEQQSQELQQQLTQQQQLVKQLEADLLAMSSSSNGDKVGAHLGQQQPQQQSVGSNIDGEGSMDADLLQLMSSSGTAAAAGDSSSSADGAATMLPVVVAQRDRFRSRIVELESEQSVLKQQLQDSQAQIEGLTADNVALVEKIRFLERYKQQMQAAGGGLNRASSAVTVIRVDGAGCIVEEGDMYSNLQGVSNGSQKASRYNCGLLSLNVGPGKGSISKYNTGQRQAAATGQRGQMGKLRTRGKQRSAGCFGMISGSDLEDQTLDSSLDPEARYLKEYEARLNPFVEFQQNESESRLRGMQLHDKALLAANRLIAGSKMARVAVAVYVVLLHVFLMLLMYYSATPHAVLEEVQERTAVGAAAGGDDALAAARLAAAGAGVGEVNSGSNALAAGRGRNALRLLLGMWH